MLAPRNRGDLSPNLSQALAVTTLALAVAAGAFAPRGAAAEARIAAASPDLGVCPAQCPPGALATCEHFSAPLDPARWLTVSGSAESGPPDCGLRLACSPQVKSEIQSAEEML